MMRETVTASEKRKLNQIAREYEQMGYTVVLRPQPSDLPPFLSQFQPDLVAFSDSENVVIEVRSRESLGDRRENIKDLAEAIDRHGGWRFELVVMNPRSGAREIDSELELSMQEIHMRIGIARELLSDGQPELAALAAWSATEAMLRKIASANQIIRPQQQPAALLKQVYVAGLLDTEDYDVLKRAMQERDLVAHGYRLRSPAEEWVSSLIDLTSHLAYARGRDAVA